MSDVFKFPPSTILDGCLTMVPIVAVGIGPGPQLPGSHLSQPLGHADGLPLAASRSFLADFVQKFLKELPPFLAALHLQVPAASPGARTWPVVPQVPWNLVRRKWPTWGIDRPNCKRQGCIRHFKLASQTRRSFQYELPSYPEESSTVESTEPVRSNSHLHKEMCFKLGNIKLMPSVYSGVSARVPKVLSVRDCAPARSKRGQSSVFRCRQTRSSCTCFQLGVC